MPLLKNNISKIILFIIEIIFVLPIICYVIEGINGLGKVVGTYIRLLGKL